MIWLLAVAVILPSFLVSLVSVGIVKGLAGRIGLLDKPNARKVHTNPIPLGGGIGVWCGLVFVFLVGTCVAYLGNESLLAALGLQRFSVHLPGMKDKALEIWAVIGCGTILVVLGLMDDRRGLAWQVRLIVEFIVAAIVVFGLRIRFTAFIDSTIITGLASMFWIVALINSFNMLDNMDGLSAGWLR